MAAQTDDRDERTEETEETSKTPSADSALIAWLGAIHAEVQANRAEVQATRAELREEIRDLSGRVSCVEERLAHLEGGVESERAGKNRALIWLGIGVAVFAALATVSGVAVGVISLLN